MGNESHCARAVSQVLRTVAGFEPHAEQVEGQPCFLSSENGRKAMVASYGRQFDYLWGVADCQGKGLLDELTVLCKEAQNERPFDLCLVNDTPQKTVTEDSRDTAKRTTIYDFLVALSLTLEKQCEDTLPRVRILVVD